MFLEGRVMIKQCIDKICRKLSVGQKQWLWFIVLWLGGFFSVLTLSYAIKFMMGL